MTFFTFPSHFVHLLPCTSSIFLRFFYIISYFKSRFVSFNLALNFSSFCFKVITLPSCLINKNAIFVSIQVINPLSWYCFLYLKSCQCARFPTSQKVTVFALGFFIRDKLHVFQYSLWPFFPLFPYNIYFMLFQLFPYNIYFMLFLLSPQSITFHCSFTMYFLYSPPYITNRTYESPTVTRLKFFKYKRIHEQNILVAFELFGTVLRSYISNNQHLCCRPYIVLNSRCVHNVGTIHLLLCFSKA